MDSASFEFEAVARAKDGGYAFLVGFDDRKSNLGNRGDMSIVRTDSLGTILWSTNLNSDTTEAGTGIRATPDGGFVVCGWSAIPQDPTKGKIILAKLDSLVNLKWSNQFGGNRADEGQGIAVLNNGNIAVGGFGTEPSGQVVLIIF